MENKSVITAIPNRQIYIGTSNKGKWTAIFHTTYDLDVLKTCAEKIKGKKGNKKENADLFCLECYREQA